MSVRHTGGEWSAVIDPDDERDADIEIVAEGSAPIATVLGAANFPCLDPDGADFDAIRAEQEATARLMASAPDLLTACCRALEFVRDKARLMDGVHSIHAANVAETLVNAIAKAQTA